MDAFMNVSIITTIVGVLVVLVNMIVEVLKKITWDKIPTNIVAVVVSLALTLIAFFAYSEINAIVVTWYMIVAAIVVGFMVSYAAMFGYDKLKEVLASINSK